MTPAALALARRLAAHKSFHWEPGMSFAYPVDDIGFGACYRWPGVSCCAENGVQIAETALRTAVPDLDDPATRGWLLSFLDDEGETVISYSDGEGIAAALLAAWGEP